MGFTPQQVNAMSVWQFEAAVAGYIAANSASDGNKLSEGEADDLFDWISRDSGKGRSLSTMTYWWEGERLSVAGRVEFQLHR